MADQNQQQEQPIVAEITSSEDQQHSSIMVDPTTNTTYLLLRHAPSSTTPSCCCFTPNNNNFLKRRSPPSSSSSGADDAKDEHRACKKKHYQEDQLTHLLNHNAFSAISLLPLSSNGTFQNPCCGGASSGCRLSPLLSQRSLQGQGGFVSCDPSSPSPAATDKKGPVFTKQEEEEASNSIKLRRIRECLRELRKRWDEMIREGEEEEDDPEPERAESDGLLSKDECDEGDAEEAVSVEWTDDKFLTICFKCPCSKGHQVLLSGNICYHKLV